MALTLFAQEAVSATFLNKSAFSQSVLSRKKGAAKIILLQYVLTTTRALPIFHGSAYERSYMQDCRLLVRLHRKTGIPTGLKAQPGPKAGRALTNSVGLETFQTTYFPYLIYDGRTPLPHVLMSSSDDLSPCSQQESLNWVRSQVTT